MKFTIQQPALADVLGWALTAIPTRPLTPALSGVRVEVASGVARCTGFDFETMAASTTTVDSETDGWFVAPGRTVHDVVKNLPKTRAVTLETVDGRLRITSDRSEYTVPLIPSDQYPKVPELPRVAATVDGGKFADAVKRAQLSAAKDDSTKPLLGLHITGTAGQLVIESSDRYRVYEETVPVDLNGDVEWLVRADRIAGKVPSAGEVQIVAGEALFGFRTGTRALVTSLMADQFPSVARLWPADPGTTVTVDRDDLVAALQAVATVADVGRPVELVFESSEVRVSGGDTDGRGVEYVPCEASAPITVSYNPSYLRDALNQVGGEVVTLAFTVPTRPVVVTGVGGRRALAMPKKIK